MPRGGSKPGERRGGRAAGTPNKATRMRMEMIDQAVASGKTPLQVMLLAIEKLLAKKQFTAAANIAKDAAPYVHPRLSSVEQRVEGILREYAVSDEPLSADEWAAKYGARPKTDAKKP